ncbi:MAG: DUF3800 domain-containing protein [Sphingobacteriia bacterium]|nr:DUF3800 domain-containing protein [Sphingobacteriia bacterium]
MKYPFIFIDESGVTDDPNRPQPYYSIGLLKVYDSAKITWQILQAYNKSFSVLRSNRKKLITDLQKEPRILTDKELNSLLASTTHYEYKFSAVRQDNLDLYKSFINILFKNKFHFCAFVVNRRDINYDQKIHDNYWEAYLGYCKTVCKCNIAKNERATVIADYMNKPKSSMKLLETELLSLTNINNVLRSQSLGTPLLQACDILLGAVALQHKIKADVLDTSSKNFQAKFELSKYIEEKLFGDFDFRLSGKAITRNIKKDSIYFSVFPLKMQKEVDK